MREFDLRALHAALDKQRQALGLTWAEATRQIGAVGPRLSLRPIASSTITGLRTKRLAEGDGVLQMLRWLGRPPESFVEGCPPALMAEAELPDRGSPGVLRFDTRRLFEALDAERKARRFTWAAVERETGVAASHARGLARGGRTAFPGVMRLTAWLRRPAADFVRISDV